MDDVPTVKCDEAAIGPSLCHFLNVSPRRNLAISPSDQKSWAIGRKPVNPMVTI